MLLRCLIFIVSVGVFALVVWGAGTHSANQWDFRTYYTAAQTHAAGNNPYPSGSSQQRAEPAAKSGYVYPPHTLTYFRGFAKLDYRQAAWLYLGLKCVVFVGLFFLWRAVFLRNELNIWFVPFALLAFNGATCMDLTSGNVQMFELALLWVAFACYVRGWDLLFGGVLLAAASFRLMPVLFLGMYLVAGRGRWALGILLGGAFLAGLFLARRFAPDLFSSFFYSVIAVRDDGWNSPALWPLLQGVRDYLSLMLGREVPNRVAVVAYFLVFALVAAVSIVIGKRIEARCPDESRARLLQVFLACFAYVIVVPHLRPSGYMLLLVPTFYLLRHAPPLHAGIALGALVVIPGNAAAGWQYLAPIGVIVNEYYLWLTAVLLWGLFCYQYRNGGEAVPSEAVLAAPPPESSEPPRPSAW